MGLSLGFRLGTSLLAPLALPRRAVSPYLVNLPCGSVGVRTFLPDQGRGGRLDHPQASFYHSNERCQPLNRRHMLASSGARRRRSYPARRELSERKSSLFSYAKRRFFSDEGLSEPRWLGSTAGRDTGRLAAGARRAVPRRRKTGAPTAKRELPYPGSYSPRHPRPDFPPGAHGRRSLFCN